MTIFSLIPDIKKNSLFINCSEEYANKYLHAEAMSVSHFSPHSIAYSSESRPLRVAFILDGTAQVYAVHSDERALLRTLSSGDVFGIANLYDEDEPFPSQIVTTTECSILFIDGNAFREFIENDKKVLRSYLTLQSKKIVYLNKKISGFTAGSAEKKLAIFILDHKAGGLFTPPCSMSQLANMLGIGRASLYRAIDTLTLEGYIKKQEKNTFILNENKLKNFIK